jgi:hypothetical protein
MYAVFHQFSLSSIILHVKNNKDLKLTAFLKLRYGLVGTFFCGKFVFHEKDNPTCSLHFVLLNI